MANAISIIRITASIALLFCKAFSPAFYVFYIAAGLTDMLDGFVARKTDTASSDFAESGLGGKADHEIQRNPYRRKRLQYSIEVLSTGDIAA